MSDQRLKIAVFIDFDNVEIGVKTTLGRQFDIGGVLEAIKERGEIITKVAYGDWKRAGDYGRAMSQHAVRLVQRVMTPGGDKNGADINLALDALEMAFTHDHINAFVIVGGDSDFITLVEKLKQYDKKVFVVGGRAFTSQVMQKNCTEFIAYENVTSAGATGAAPVTTDRRRGDRTRVQTGVPLDQAFPLVKRALKVLADREVSPQLGLLKSTLLQLDSSFSERDYGSGSFRDFAEKLEKQGLVSLKHSGRSTLVELAGESDVDRAASEDAAPPSPVAVSRAAGASTAVQEATQSAVPDANESIGPANGNLAEGVALVRSILADATVSPRWPMYVRQFKQFIRSARADFDERRYGSIVDLMRACQKDGFLRLERDRQGALRVFATGPVRANSLPHGWSTITADHTQPAAVDDVIETMPIAEEPSQAAFVVESDDARGNVAPLEEKKARRPRRTQVASSEGDRPKRARKSPPKAKSARAETRGRSKAR